MKLDDDLDTAAGLLKRAVPEMVRRRIPVDPVNYALWYGYVSGREPDLANALDAGLPDAESYSREFVERLFYKHVVEPRVPADAALGDAALGILAELLERVGASTSGTRDFGFALERGISTLRSSSDQAVIRRTLEDLVEDTRRVREQQAAFEAELGAAQREIEGLRDRLSRSEEQALHDPLTGLNNRRRFDAALSEAMAAGTGIALVLLDIDHFKRLNDGFGHAAGDAVLRRVGAVLLRHECDLILPCRLGGEEFAALLCGAEAHATAERFAERLRREVGEMRVEDPVAGGLLPPVSASFGVALHVPGEAPDALYQRADAALYEAKDGGRDQVRCAA